MAARRANRDEDDLKRRAFAGYWRYARTGQPRAPLDDTKATVIEIDEKLYVVLTSGKVQLAVFRVRADGQLKRLVRPPRELKQDES